jgi:hypothetical protein
MSTYEFQIKKFYTNLGQSVVVDDDGKVDGYDLVEEIDGSFFAFDGYDLDITRDGYKLRYGFATMDLIPNIKRYIDRFSNMIEAKSKLADKEGDTQAKQKLLNRKNELLEHKSFYNLFLDRLKESE